MRDADGAINAIRHVKEKLGRANAGRVKWVISTRPEFWNSDRVLAKLAAEFEVALPASEPATGTEDVDDFSPSAPPLTVASPVGVPRGRLAVYRIEPLEAWQAERLLRESFGVANPRQVLDEAGRLGLGFAARRPGDLRWLSAVWRMEPRPQTLQEALSRAAEELLKEPSASTTRAADSRLPQSTASAASKLLAAAMYLCEKPNISIPKETGTLTTQDLNADKLLTDMPLVEKQHLLSLPLYVESDNGASVRLQPDRIAQFLASEWFRPLCEEDAQDLFHFFTVETRDGRIVLPSLAPIAGWLATWNAEFRRLLLADAPEVVALFGDMGQPGIPEQDVQRAADGLLSFLASGREPSSVYWFQDDDYRQLGVRLSPDYLRKGLKRFRREPRVLRFLMRAISAARRSELADDLMRLVKERWPDQQGLDDIVDALSEVGSSTQRDTLAKMLQSSSAAKVPNHVFRAVIAATFPTYISPQALARLTFSQQRWSEDDLTIRLMLSDNLTSSHMGTTLQVAEALAEGLDGRYGTVAATAFRGDVPAAMAIAGILETYLKRTSEREFDVSAFTAVIVKVFRWAVGAAQSISGSMQMEDIAPLLLERPALRRTVLEACMTELREEQWWALRRSSIGTPVWVMPGDVDFLRELSSRDGWLGRECARRWVEALTAPPPVNAEPRTVTRPKRTTRDFTTSKATLHQQIDGLRDGSNLSAIGWVAKWLSAEDSSFRSNYSSAAWDKFQEAFGEELAIAAKAGFSAMWRRMDPQRDLENDNSTHYTTIAALQILREELQDEAAMRSLSPAEALRAAKYAILEINGFPEWLWKLAAVHPEPVSRALADELLSARAATGRVAQDVAYQLSDAPEAVRGLVAPALWAWLKTAQKITASLLVSAAKTALDIGAVQREEVVEEARTRAIAEASRANADEAVDEKTGWPALWLYADASGFIAWCKSPRNRKRAKRLLQAVGEVIGDSDRLAVSLSAHPSLVLAKLYLLLCQYFPPATPKGRGSRRAFRVTDVHRFERFRDSLPQRISEQSGPQAFEALTYLIDSVSAARLQQYFIHLRRLLIEHDNRRTPFTEEQVLQFPQTRIGALQTDGDLFHAVVRHVRAAAANVEHGEFSLGPLFRAFGKTKASARRVHEEDFQLWLAAELAHRSRGRYSIHREPQRSSGSKLDISAAVAGCKVAVELKVADKWTLSELRTALRKQLSGEYLRHRQCRHGVYVLVRLHKQHWNKGRTKVSFAALIEGLQKVGRDVVDKANHGGQITVVGIDCPAGASRSPHAKANRDAQGKRERTLSEPNRGRPTT